MALMFFGEFFRRSSPERPGFPGSAVVDRLIGQTGDVQVVDGNPPDNSAGSVSGNGQVTFCRNINRKRAGPIVQSEVADINRVHAALYRALRLVSVVVPVVTVGKTAVGKCGTRSSFTSRMDASRFPPPPADAARSSLIG